MAITHDASSNSSGVDGTSVSSLTFAHTCSGSDRVLIVGITADDSIDADRVISSVTYNGVGMTAVATNNDNSANLSVYLYRLFAPATGANNIVVTFAGTVSTCGAFGVSFNGVHQTAATDGSNNAGSTTNNAAHSANQTVNANGCLIVDVVYCGTNLTGTPVKDASQTQIAAFAPTTFTYTCGSYEIGSVGTVAMSWTGAGSSSDWKSASMSLRPTGPDIKTVKPAGGGDFTTLSAWTDYADGRPEAEQWAECYAGNLGTCSLGAWGATPSSTVYPRIYAATGERHDGRDPTTGAYITTAIATNGINCYLEYARIEGIAIDGFGTADQGVRGLASNILIDGILSKDAESCVGFEATDSTITGCVARNCLAVGGLYPFVSNVFAGSANASVTSAFYNCTASCSGSGTNGFSPYTQAGATYSATATTTIKNCVAVDADSGDFAVLYGGGGGTETNTMTNTNCASEDATADDFGGSGNIVNQTVADLFVGSGDYYPKTGSNLINAGTDLSGTFTNDISETTTRPQGAAFEIGAWEYIPVAATSHFLSLLGVGT